ncbi:hypothetical protein V9T40_006876 [Parthenolecanium corni]|uniref:Uncharacterized protein n=1 Tax=Parthenolecanium corni TaxID=536013 RepID=A0AAN9TQA8_9HEMI
MKKGTRDSWKTAKACHQLPAPADQQYNLQIAVNSSGELSQPWEYRKHPIGVELPQSTVIQNTAAATELLLGTNNHESSLVWKKIIANLKLMGNSKNNLRFTANKM